MHIINIIGAGYWGPNIIRSLESTTGVIVHQIADLNEARLNQLKERYQAVTVTTRASEAIQDPTASAVVISTPVATHYGLAKAALEAGKHVFMEKPMCRTSAECLDLMDLAEARGLALMVGHIFLFNPGILKLKQLLEDREVGQVLYFDAVRTNLGPVRPDVNALWDLASHDISIFQYLTGASALRVSCSGSRALGQRVEDTAFACIEYPGNVLAHLHASWLNPQKVRQITVVGDRKMALWDDIDLTHPVTIYDCRVDIDEEEVADTFGSHRTSYHKGDVVIPSVPGGEPLRNEMEHFIECIRTGATPRTDGASGLEVIRILEAADESTET